MTAETLDIMRTLTFSEFYGDGIVEASRDADTEKAYIVKETSEIIRVQEKCGTER